MGSAATLLDPPKIPTVGPTNSTGGETLDHECPSDCVCWEVTACTEEVVSVRGVD